VPFPLLNGALWILHFFHVSAAEYRQALEAGEQLLALAPRAGDPLFVATAHVALGWVLPYLGEFSAARDHLQRMIDFRERQPQRPLCFVDQQNLVTALSYQSWALWFLGYPESAAEKSRAALALARELGHAWTLAHAYSTAGAAFHLFRREGLEAQHHVEALTQVSAEAGLAIARAEAMCYRGWQQMLLGQTVEGIQQLQQGLAALQSVQTVRHRPSFLAALAESYLLSDPTQGLAVLAEAFSLTEQTSERYYLAELHRLKGESLRTLGHVAEAEASFHQAIETARQQQARSWELRAVISLCRLWQKQGKRKAARAMLTDIYGWFKQGLDTPDLTEAAALLEQLL